MPPSGGDTCFADMHAALALPEARRDALSELRVVHSWEHSRDNVGMKMSAAEIADAPPMSHPLVRLHPETGKPALFLGAARGLRRRHAVRRRSGADCGTGGALYTSAVLVPPHLVCRRHVDVGQPLPVTPRGRELRDGAFCAYLHRTCLPVLLPMDSTSRHSPFTEQNACACLSGGTGPTGPFIVNGLLERGYDVSVLNRGVHDTPEIPAHVEQVVVILILSRR